MKGKNIIKKTELRTLVKEVLKKQRLNEGSSNGNLNEARYRFEGLFNDLIYAINGKNGGNDPALPNAKQLTNELKSISKKLASVFKKYNQEHELWFRDLI